MLCYAIDQKPTNIGSPPSPAMYRNLQSDSNTAPPSGFFQPGYAPKLGAVSTGYTSTNYSVLSSHPSVPEYPTSSLGLDYQSPFIPSGHDVTTTQSPWGYPNTNFQSMLNTHPSWDSMGNPFHVPQPTSSSYHPGLTQPSLVNGEGSPGSSTALTGIECFTTPPEGAPGIHVSTMHPGIPTQRRPYEWINKNAYQNVQPQQVGKTRTKDKYRVVYSDHQRLELEKEFRFSRYITIRRKAELAGQLCLSERQVKIWFQNRRAKERKASKKSGENSKNVDGDIIEDHDDADDDVSEHSGHGLTSSPPIMQHSNVAFTKPNEVHSAEQGFAIPEQQEGITHHLPPMPYSYGVHHSPQENIHYEQMGSMAELKPIMCNSEPHVMSPTDDLNNQQMRISPTCHQL